MGDLLEAMRPIVAAPGEDLRRLVGQVNPDTVAIELDFMNPALSGRHLLDRGGQGRFNEAGEGRLDADCRRFLALKRHDATPLHFKLRRYDSFRPAGWSGGRDLGSTVLLVVFAMAKDSKPALYGSLGALYCSGNRNRRTTGVR
jgi:hypothetical protein